MENAATIFYDTVVNDTISEIVDMKAYLFEGDGGDIITIRMDPSGGFDTRLELIDPSDSLIQILETYWSGEQVNLVEFTLPSSGTYTIFIRDQQGDEICTYWLSLQCRQHIIANADTILVTQGTIEKTLDNYGAMKAYIFLVDKDDTANIKMTRSSGNIDPCMELYGPSDSLIITVHNNYESEIDDSYFTESGVYTLIVSDYQGNETGSYKLTWYGFLGGRLIQVSSIISPSGIVPLSPSITPKAVVTNIGWQEEIFSAKFQIYTIYSDSIVDLSLLPGESDTISFAKLWQPSEAAAYITTCSSQLEGNLGGDEKKGTVFVSSGIGPEIYGRYPDIGINTGPFTMNITGSGFENGITASLEKTDEPAITTEACDIEFISSEEINTTFDIENLLEATYNLKVTNPDNDSYVFYEGLKITTFPDQEIPFGSWEYFNVAEGTMINVGVNVPSGLDDLFILIKKTTHIGYSGTWSGGLRLLKQGEEIGYESGNDDFDIHIQNPEYGWYDIEIWSSDPGEGLIRACSALDTLLLGEWKIGEILRPYGCDWKQLDVPENQLSLYFQTEGFGLWSTLDVYYENLDDPTQHWQFLNWGAGYHIEGEIENPPAGRYYLKYMDSAVMQGTDDQTRQYMIIADTEPILELYYEPTITDLSTYVGGTAGPVTVIISGAGLDSAATVSLVKDGYDDVLAEYVVGDSTMRSLRATFDFSETELGEWILKVTNPDGQSVNAPSPFIVESGGEPEFYSEVIGREQIRIGRLQTYILHYSNLGSIDAENVIFDLSFIPPEGYKISLFRLYGSNGDILKEVEVIDSLYIWVPCVGPMESRDMTFEIKFEYDSQNKDGGKLFKIVVKTLGGASLDALIDALRETLNELGAQIIEGAELEFNDIMESILNHFKEKFPEALFDEIMEYSIPELIAAGLLPPNWTDLVDIFKTIKNWMGKLFELMELWQELQRLIELVNSTTPEDKYGPSGYDPPDTPITELQRFISSTREFSYRIDFWNADTATAPAQEVFIVDTLNTYFVDSTITFTEFGFLRWTIPLEGGQYFNINVDMRPDTNLIVNVEGKYDQDTREISWTFRSLDPETMELPPMAGFLPPITETGYEIGWVDFTIETLSGLPSGTKITNQAFVNFDEILGPDSLYWSPAPKEGPYVNTIDCEPPTSNVEVLEAEQHLCSFTINLTGQDDENGSSIAYYLIYVSDNGAEYELWLTTQDNQATYKGKNKHTYRFYSIAVDNVGNKETAPVDYDAITTIKTVPTMAVSPSPFVPSRGHTVMTFFGAKVAGSEIKIFNKAGEYIKTLEVLEGEDTITWDGKSKNGKDVASGVYIWILTTSSGDKYKDKFAIIR